MVQLPLSGTDRKGLLAKPWRETVSLRDAGRPDAIRKIRMAEGGGLRLPEVALHVESGRSHKLRSLREDIDFSRPQHEAASESAASRFPRECSKAR